MRQLRARLQTGKADASRYGCRALRKFVKPSPPVTLLSARLVSPSCLSLAFRVGRSTKRRQIPVERDGSEPARIARATRKRCWYYTVTNGEITLNPSLNFDDGTIAFETPHSWSVKLER